jgi:hypothetical protein
MREYARVTCPTVIVSNLILIIELLVISASGDFGQANHWKSANVSLAAISI